MVFLIIAAVLAASYFYNAYKFQPLLEQAFQAYQEGEKTNQFSTREEAFNRALAIYLELEKQFQLKDGDGKLYYNIANTYFQLGQYAKAVLYYYRALSLRPQDYRVDRNLARALEKLEIKKAKNSSLSLPLPFKLQLFSLLCVAFFTCISLYLWFRNRYFKWAAWLLIAPLLLVFLSITYSFYFAPLEGVALRASSIYRDAGAQYARVDSKLLTSGQKVVVLEVVGDGKWLKILGPDGTLGYVPSDTIGLI